MKEVKEPGKLYHTCITTITTLASFGLIHADFNEFNLILAYEGDEEEDDGEGGRGVMMMMIGVKLVVVMMITVGVMMIKMVVMMRKMMVMMVVGLR